MKTRFPSPARARSWHWQPLAWLGTACSLLLLVPPLASAQAPGSFLQAPIQTGGTGVPPNFMYTMDDSGSMWYECVPEALCATGVNAVELIPTRFSAGPGTNPTVRRGTLVYDDINDPRVVRVGVSAPNNVIYSPGAWPGSAGAGGSIFGSGWHGPSLQSRKARSSEFNSLYYNPEITYLPWLRPNGVTRWDPSDPYNAPQVPGLPQVQTLVGPVTVSEGSAGRTSGAWCMQHDPTVTRCQSASNYQHMATEAPVHIARYYLLISGRAGTSPNDFKLIKIESNKTYPRTTSDVARNKTPGTRSDCLGSRCTFDEEIRNFANWYTYHRTRIFAAIAGTAEAFAKVPPEFRVGYGSVNNPNVPVFSGKNIDGFTARDTIEKGVRPFTGTDKTAFYDWLYAIKPSGATGLPRATDTVGQYFQFSGNGGPWGNTPGDTADLSPINQHSPCRRSIHVLMTDGYWNENLASDNPLFGQNIDGTAGTTVTGPGGQTYTYTPTAPYSDVWSTTLADVAMHYWMTDLRPDLDNLVKPVQKQGSENPAFWQHLSMYGIAFGVGGTLDNPADLPALQAGTKSWPNPAPGSSSGSPTNLGALDDLWHATINSRGKLLSARNSVEYTAALASVIDDVTTASSGSESGVSVSTNLLPSVGTTNRKYTPMFGAGWSGDVIAENINERGEAQNTAWAAAAKLAETTANTRRIFSYNPATKAGVPFYSWSLSPAMNADIGTARGRSTNDLINFIRGDRTNEGTGANQFRKRTSDTSDGSNTKPVLGDIVNSTPALVADLLNMFYSFLPVKNSIGTIDWGRESYSRFLAAKKLRTGHLAVGANDGMLHMFSESGQIPATAGDGNEAFAYVPNAVLKSLKLLADPAYDHIYFVDGPITEADVYDKTNARWKNMVIGTSGAGMRATSTAYDVPFIYAINMPVPTWTSGSNPPTALTAAQSAPGQSDVMWEISRDTICSDGTQCFSGMGHVITRPEVGVLKDGRWVVIFGNGYRDMDTNLTDLIPKLYIVDALTGNLIKRIDTGSFDSAGGRNGLGGVGVVRDAQMRIVAAYGGDLVGNLWKFDLTSDNPNSWGMAFFDTAALPTAKAWPLFTATNSNSQPEPIIAKPAFRAMPGGGVIVLFGTGQLHAVGDVSNTDERTLYGVTDTNPVGAGSPAATRVTNGKAGLVPQLTGNGSPSVISGSVGTTYRKFVVNPVDYSTKRGWYLPLRIGAGERLINEPQIRFDGVLMQTVRPLNNSSDCTGSKVTRQGYLLDPFMSGAARLPFDGNADGIADSNIVEIQGTGDNLLVMRAPKCTGPHCSSQTPTPPCTGPACNRMQCPKTGVIMGAGSGGVEACFGSDAIRRQWRQLVSPPQ